MEQLGERKLAFEEREPVLAVGEKRVNKNWFGLSNAGWVAMNKARSMGHLVREAVANAFDAKPATVKLFLEPGYICVEDDSVGFSSPELIYTVFLTDKEDSHLQRGRKGRGLKELLAAGNQANVETVGCTVTFSKEGRIEVGNTRKNGTKIEVWGDWKNYDVEIAVEYLRTFIPPCTLIINDVEVSPPELVETFKAELPTVVFSNGAQTTRTIETEVKLYKSESIDFSHLYEMGIPIQVLGDRFNVDIQQRVPVSDDRNTADSSFVSKLDAVMLKNFVDRWTRVELMSSRWISNGLYWVDSDVKKKFADKFVDKRPTALKSTNAKANARLKERGYELIETNSLQYSVKSALEGNILDAEVIAKRLDSEAPDGVVVLTEQHRAFQSVISWLVKDAFGLQCAGDHHIRTDQVTFFAKGEGIDGTHQSCKVTKSDNSIVDNGSLPMNIAFNVSHPSFNIEKPMSSGVMTSLVEALLNYWWDPNLDHCPDTPFSEVAKIAGALASAVSRLPRDIREVTKVHPGKTTFITCVDCGVKREIKVQDVHQCSRCLECQRKAARLRAKMRRINREASGSVT